MPRRTTRWRVQKQESAEANLGSAAAAIAKAQAALEQQQAAVSMAEENLRNATIVSPIDGVVLSRDSEVGTAVSSILLVGSSATLDHDRRRSERSLRERQSG